ncbi:hypothetical protein TVAG_119890 [Trichomonas vaginalis G3]|uniref:Uncharacterized protein n=1 Tax=Trichomonas vaginalis (strain ATCC PRA-98 / G3) TaxID=412133 RepID=A2D7D5_TRIV3|nr:hypothetical protein TVAGG3_0992770 [Trichomonas vaginalis G3]EAY23652.1 hypothetical protein TVAG_119890 [Trichomonas vaginalis G3]KAI5490144.1 hypothetical protein TVAGG3_0992770 [Trichomonas vaginalis G3]|eukprot:XP_001276900.1 hypothetical protein [Trichomonas vaginalis G3]
MNSRIFPSVVILYVVDLKNTLKLNSETFEDTAKTIIELIKTSQVSYGYVSFIINNQSRINQKNIKILADLAYMLINKEHINYIYNGKCKRLNTLLHYYGVKIPRPDIYLNKSFTKEELIDGE